LLLFTTGLAILAAGATRRRITSRRALRFQQI
jgi:hypothetical protein